MGSNDLGLGRDALVIGMGRGERAPLSVLSRRPLGVQRFPRPSRSLDLITEVPFRLLLLRFPLSDIGIEQYLEVLRAPDSAARGASLALLTDKEHRAEAERWLGHGANRVICFSDPLEITARVLAELVDVAPRKSARLTARLQARVDGNSEAVFCQTENVSESGMLIGVDGRYEPGTEVRFELRFPGASRATSGTAQVVRTADVRREGLHGLGLRFVDLGPESERDLAAWLSRP